MTELRAFKSCEMSDSEELINYLSSEDTESDLSSSVETVSNVIFLGAAALLQDTRTAIKRYVEDVVPQYSETEFLQIKTKCIQNVKQQIQSV